MLNDDNIITAQLEEDGRTDSQLRQISEDLLAATKATFTDEHTIKISDPDLEDEDEWNRVIKVTNGAKVGASMDIRWDAHRPDQVQVEIDEKTKFGTIVFAVCVAPLFFLGMYMGIEEIPPLDFLPGYKIAAILGGIILAIPGGILGAVLKSILMKKEAPVNKKLRADLVALVKKYFEGGASN